MNQDNTPIDLRSDRPDQGEGWPVWRTSTVSDLIECVAVANLDGTIGVRNTRDPSGATLIFPRSEFEKWLEQIKAGAYDHLAP